MDVSPSPTLKSSLWKCRMKTYINISASACPLRTFFCVKSRTHSQFVHSTNYTGLSSLKASQHSTVPLTRLEHVFIWASSLPFKTTLTLQFFCETGPWTHVALLSVWHTVPLAIQFFFYSFHSKYSTEVAEPGHRTLLLLLHGRHSLYSPSGLQQRSNW